MKKVLHILTVVLSILLLIFIWIPPKTVVKSVDEDGNETILNVDSLDKKHKESYKNYGK